MRPIQRAKNVAGYLLVALRRSKSYGNTNFRFLTFGHNLALSANPGRGKQDDL